MNGYDLVRLQPNQVKKTGDTMTGNLTIKHTSPNISIVNSNATKPQARLVADNDGNVYLQAGKTSTDNSGTLSITGFQAAMLKSMHVKSPTTKFDGDINVKEVQINGALNIPPDALVNDSCTNIREKDVPNTPGQFNIVRNFGHPGALKCNMQIGWYYGGANTLKYRVQNGNSGAWTQWGSIYSTLNKPTATDVGALALTGGSLAGNILPKTTNSHNLGSTGLRWQEVYCTRGAFNGSDITLKENIKSVSRDISSEKTISDKDITSQDFYDYVKNFRASTFNYRGTYENFVGVIANDIPERVFSKIGVMSKTDLEYEEEVAEYSRLRGVFEDKKGSFTDEDYQENIFVEEAKINLVDLKEASEAVVEKPVRLINAPAQIAMLQEVLSVALNKIDVLEKQIAELIAKLSV